MDNHSTSKKKKWGGDFLFYFMFWTAYYKLCKADAHTLRKTIPLCSFTAFIQLDR